MSVPHASVETILWGLGGITIRKEVTICSMELWKVFIFLPNASFTGVLVYFYVQKAQGELGNKHVIIQVFLGLEVVERWPSRHLESKVPVGGFGKRCFSSGLYVVVSCGQGMQSDWIGECCQGEVDLRLRI